MKTPACYGISVALLGFSFFHSNLPDVSAEPRASTAQRGANTRIVGGKAVEKGEGPWAVRLNVTRSDGKEYICGGSLVAPKRGSNGVTWLHGRTRARWVVTAAHCVDDPQIKATVPAKSIKAISGTLDLNAVSDPDPNKRRGELHDVVAIMVHKGYDRATLANDIALIVLKEPTRDYASEVRRSIRLASLRDSNWLDREYLALIAQGWGKTRDLDSLSTQRFLREVRVPLVRTEVCERKYALHGEQIRPGMICAGFYSGGFDSCGGDSGGPLLFRPTKDVPGSLPLSSEVLVGVVSWGIGCGRQDLFGVYSSVSHYRKWLDGKVIACLENSGGDLSKCN
jgi:trypsin